MSIYAQGLMPAAVNHVALTPLSFIERTAAVYGNYPAVIHGAIRRNWQETYQRCRRLASALAGRGIGRGDTVAVMLPNTPAMLEAHFGVPMTGAVLNTSLHAEIVKQRTFRRSGACTCRASAIAGSGKTLRRLPHP